MEFFITCLIAKGRQRESKEKKKAIRIRYMKFIIHTFLFFPLIVGGSTGNYLDVNLPFIMYCGLRKLERGLLEKATGIEECRGMLVQTASSTCKKTNCASLMDDDNEWVSMTTLQHRFFSFLFKTNFGSFSFLSFFLFAVVKIQKVEYSDSS